MVNVGTCVLNKAGLPAGQSGPGKAPGTVFAKLFVVI